MSVPDGAEYFLNPGRLLVGHSPDSDGRPDLRHCGTCSVLPGRKLLPQIGVCSVAVLVGGILREDSRDQCIEGWRKRVGAPGEAKIFLKNVSNAGHTEASISGRSQNHFLSLNSQSIPTATTIRNSVTTKTPYSHFKPGRYSKFIPKNPVITPKGRNTVEIIVRTFIT